VSGFLRVCLPPAATDMRATRGMHRRLSTQSVRLCVRVRARVPHDDARQLDNRMEQREAAELLKALRAWPCAMELYGTISLDEMQEIAARKLGGE
jgi:hypothetical protein